MRAKKYTNKKARFITPKEASIKLGVPFSTITRRIKTANKKKKIIGGLYSVFIKTDDGIMQETTAQILLVDSLNLI